MKHFSSANILKEIEKKYPVDKIYLNGEQIWPFLRSEYFHTYMEYHSENPDIEIIRKKPFFQKLKLVKNIFYGWKKWFKKYDYIAISTSGKSIIKIINGKYYNRLIDPIIDELNNNDFLCIQRPDRKLYNINKTHTKNIVSFYPIYFISYLFEILPIGKYNLNGSEILNAIKKDYNINIDDDKLIKFYLAEYRTCRFIFQYIKPKAIFIGCHSSLGLMKAAKELGIKTIEIQHGIIGKEQPIYNPGVEMSKNLFPDYLFAYGKQDVMNFTNSYFIDQKNVIPIGSYYIDYLKESFSPEIKFQNIINKYSISVGITLQNTVEKQTIDFVKQAAILDSSILFILIPRQPVRRDYSKLDLPDNVLVITDKEFYELMMYVDYHSTVYSTCALEAPSFGVQNIMININNLSRKYFESSLIDRITKYADTPEEYLNLIRSMDKLDKETVYYLNEGIIMPNYRNNLKDALSQVLD